MDHLIVLQQIVNEIICKFYINDILVLIFLSKLSFLGVNLPLVIVKFVNRKVADGTIN